MNSSARRSAQHRQSCRGRYFAGGSPYTQQSSQGATRIDASQLSAGSTLRLEGSKDLAIKGVDLQGKAIIGTTQGQLSVSASSSTALITSVQSEGEVLSQSEGSTTLVGTRIQSKGGTVMVLAGQDVNLEAARNTSETIESHQVKSRGFLSSKTTTSQSSTSSTEAVGASLGGQTVSVRAGQPGASLSGGLSGIGIGSDKGSASSVTTAGVSGLAGNSAARTGEATTAIKPIFDAEKVKNEIQAQVTITQEFNKQAGQAIDRYVATQRQALQEQANKAATPEDKASAEQAIRDVNMQERALNILVAGLTGMAGSVVTKEALSTAAEKMRELMIEDSRKFAGVTDGTTTLGNLTGPSDGVRGDGQRIGGTRVDLDLLCGADNSRCRTNSDGSLDLNEQGQVQFNAKAAGMSLTQFLETTKEGKSMSGPTGGIQGAVGTLFGTPYAAGSWQDKLIEAFSGTHDMVGGRGSGLYDQQGNATRERDSLQKKAQDTWSATGAIVVSTPFAMAEFLSPDAWKAIAILLGAAK